MDAEETRHSGNLALLGGRPCLDFINTLDWRGRESPVEYLCTFPDVIRWCAHAGIITEQEAGKFYTAARENTSGAGRALERALGLRELLYDIFRTAGQGGEVPAKDLEAFNSLLGPALAQVRAAASETGVKLVPATNLPDLESLLNPVIFDAAGLLTSEAVSRVKTCANAECGWMFLDTSKNRSRQWCDMKICGNRAKARRFYRKNRG